MATNDFVPFCNENTGTNLPTQSAYLANPNLPLGNQPGIASSSLNNKALRQSSTIAAVLAQIASTYTGADMLDDVNTADHVIPAKLLAAMTAATKRHSPVVTSYLSGSGNHNVTYKFQIATGSATAAATYSDGTTTYTVKTTVAAGLQLDASGGAAPSAAAGTLTKTGGTGDATITYYAYRAPLFLRVRGAGGGGGGGGNGAGGGTGGTGGTTSFGTTLLSATGGTGAAAGVGGTGGIASLGTGPVGVALSGMRGNGSSGIAASGGSAGGSSPFGGAGSGVFNSGSVAAGDAAKANTGSGGGGPSGGGGIGPGGGGAAGGYFDAVINTPLSVYAYAVGAGGTAGTLGTSGAAGGVGAAGVIIVEEHYQ